MTKSIVDLFQTVKIEQQKREFPFRALGSADFRMQHLEKPAMIGQTGQRIAQDLTTQMILKTALFCNVDNNDFVASKISKVAEDTAAAEPGFQNGAILSLPLYFH